MIQVQQTLWGFHIPTNGDVLISIKHEFAQKIYNGTKLIELRKQHTNINKYTYCWIYEPKPIALITGYFIVNDIIDRTPECMWRLFHDALGIDKERYDKYYTGRQHAYGMIVDLAVKLPTPMSLSELGLTRPPQSYQYLRNLG